MVKENDSVYVDWQDQLKIQITVLDSCFLLVHWMLKVILITFLIPCKMFVFITVSEIFNFFFYFLLKLATKEIQH